MFGTAKAGSYLRDADAATWLDRELAPDSPNPVREAGFGCEVHAALAARRQWLVEQELADGAGDRVRLRVGAIEMLQRRELLRVGGELEGELGKTFREAGSGVVIDGNLKRRVDLASGRYALVEKSREFTLVPWQSVLERRVGTGVERDHAGGQCQLAVRARAARAGDRISKSE